MQKMMLIIAGLTLASAAPLQAQTPQHAGADQSAQHSAYAGRQFRDIKSLSGEDIDSLRVGRGLGMAKAAELNNMPGPVHLLDLKKELDLNSNQVAVFEKSYTEMKERAIPLGERLIALERSLDQAFANNDIDPGRLKTKLDEIGKLRSELRYEHLVTHLAAPVILSEDQIANYNRLRGYTK